ncbi:MAG: putative toxin-antitoxin system toxin component, PIN family [Lentisphaerae bacterium]|nr:putative toxin-antitoxin system toxin component, PIN family [Lentisphaerota bacterium]
MRVVIDTCVWVAAVRSRRGASFALLTEIPHGRFRFGVSMPLYLEYQASLMATVAGRAVPLTKEQAAAILAALAHYGTEVPVYFSLRPNLNDENDNMVFECAANFGAEMIVTHNVKHFRNPELHGYGIEILGPGEFLRRIRRTP